MVQRRPANRFIRHLLFWAGMILFFFIGFYTQPEVYPFRPIPFLVELFFTSLLTYFFYTYLLIYGLFPLLFRRAYSWFSLGLLGLNIGASMLYNTLGYVQQFIQRWIDDDLSRLVNSIVFTNPFLGSLFVEINLVAGVMAGFKLFDQWRQKQQESQLLEREKLQNELQLLKLQLNPDFLFGSLHALHTLARQQATLAPEVVLKLAHFLRYVLYESQSDMMPLLRETEIIEHYISLQRTIHPAGMDVSFSVRGNPGNRTVVPLLLFKLVEYAFLDFPAELVNPHNDEPTGISIDLAVTETQVTLKVISELVYRPDYEDNSTTDLDGLQKQLAFYYPDNHSLKIWQEDQINVVTLSISFPTNSLKTNPLPMQPIGIPT